MILLRPNQEILNMDYGYINCGALNLTWGPYSLIEAGLHPSALLEVKEDQTARSSLILNVLSSPYVSKISQRSFGSLQNRIEPSGEIVNSELTSFVYCYLLVNFDIFFGQFWFTTLIFFWNIHLPCYVSIYVQWQPLGQFWSTINHFLHILPPVCIVLGLGFYLILIQGVCYAPVAEPHWTLHRLQSNSFLCKYIY